MRWLIWLGETKKSGAESSMPALSLIVTLTPPNEVGKGTVVADCVTGLSPDPNPAAIDSVARVNPAKFAADVTAKFAAPKQRLTLGRMTMLPLNCWFLKT